MKGLVLAAIVAAIATSPAGAIAKAPQAKDSCPAFTLTSSALSNGASRVEFKVTPPNDKLDYNWTVSAGTVISGQGTPSLLVDIARMPKGSNVTADVDVKEDVSCPNRNGSLSSTVKVP